MVNPYGEGFASETIARVLSTIPLSQELLMKRNLSTPCAPRLLGGRDHHEDTAFLSDITERDIEAVTGVLRSSRLSLGPKLREFEGALSQYLGAGEVIAVHSGTSGLHLCIRALGISEGDEVIVPSFTFIAAANAVRYEKATPVFVDIEPETLNLDPTLLEAAITSRTRAIIVVHTFGCPADLSPIVQVARRHGLYVIEDACEAIGAEYRRPKSWGCRRCRRLCFLSQQTDHHGGRRGCGYR